MPQPSVPNTIERVHRVPSERRLAAVVDTEGRAQRGDVAGSGGIHGAMDTTGPGQRDQPPTTPGGELTPTVRVVHRIAAG